MNAANINQINKAKEEKNFFIEKLDQNLDVSIFRKFREIYNNYNLEDNYLLAIIELANKNFDITILNENMFKSDKFLLFNILNKCDKKTILKLYVPEINHEKRIYLYYNLELLKFSKYEKDILQIFKEKDISGLEDEFLKNTYEKDQIEYIIKRKNENKLNKEILDPKYKSRDMKLLDYFIDNSLDKNVFFNYNEEEKTMYYNLISNNKKINNFYDKNYSQEIINFVTLCESKNVPINDSIDIIKNELYEDKVLTECYSLLYANGLGEKAIKLFIDNKEDFEIEKKVEIALEYFFRNEKNIPYLEKLFERNYEKGQLSIIRNSLLFNDETLKYLTDDFSYEQMEYMLSLLKYKNDISCICNKNYSVRDMKRIYFYNSKGIFYENKEDYYKNYVKDKNKDFKTFVEMADKYDLYTNNSFCLIQILLQYNEANNTEIDIEEVLDAKAYICIDEIIKDLNDNLDINKIWKSEYSSSERNVIREELIKERNNKSIISNEER